MPLTIDPRGLETEILHRLIDFRAKDVLEVGCGDGRMTWRFAELTRSVVAIDPDPALIQEAEQILSGEARFPVELRVSDVTTAVLPASSFDVAVFSGSL